MTKTEIINKAIKELEKHIEFCEQEADGSLNNEICHISLKFDKKLLNILKGKENTEKGKTKMKKATLGNKKLEWYVLNHDFNTKEVYNFNVLQEGYILDLIRMINDKYYNVQDYNSLKECIKRWANYHFNHKTEYEIFVNGWFDKEDKSTKISVYDQLEPNLDILTKYINEELKIV